MSKAQNTASGELLERLKSTSDAQVREAVRLARDRHYTEALEACSKALSYNKNNVAALNLSGLICYQTGEIGQATAFWKKSAAAQPKDNRALGYLKELDDSGLTFYNQVQSQKLYNEALAMLKNKKERKYAEARLRKAVSLNKSNLKPLLLLALCEMEDKEFKKASETLDQAAQVEPEHPQIRRYRTLIADAEQAIQDKKKFRFLETDEETEANNERGINALPGTFLGALMQIGIFVLGALLACGLMALLYVPNKIDAYKQKALEAMNVETEVRDRVAALQEENNSLKDEIALTNVDARVVAMREQVEALMNEINVRDSEMEKEQSIEKNLYEFTRKIIAGNYTTVIDAMIKEDTAEYTTNQRSCFNNLRNYVAKKNGNYILQKTYYVYQDAQVITDKTAARAKFADAITWGKRAYFLGTNNAKKAEALYYIAACYWYMGNAQEAEDYINQFYDIYTVKGDFLENCAAVLKLRIARDLKTQGGGGNHVR